LSAFFLTWLTWADQVSRMSRFIPRYSAVSTHCIGCPKSWDGLGLWTHLVVLENSTAVLFEMLIAILQSDS
jgi:hypothetical protein